MIKKHLWNKVEFVYSFMHIFYGMKFTVQDFAIIEPSYRLLRYTDSPHKLMLTTLPADLTKLELPTLGFCNHMSMRWPAIFLISL